ncbi:Ig-like domain repeat protein [Microbacterium sp. 1154]|uniref:Ig-like domain repeat protein n=1 Tax=Microbacterium sp. 1154 TaxID=2817733 RepID=UPI00286B86FD|nr:Ig-like domain repeat protein [Microbacterium sp. 1154]
MTAALTFAGAVSAQAADTSCVSGVCTVTFAYSGAAEQWVVPSGVTSVTATISAGSGGASAPNSYQAETGAGGLGGSVRATLTVEPGEKLTAVVGGAGKRGVPDSLAPAAGGFGGGGSAGTKDAALQHSSGGGGGGGSFLFSSGSLLLATGGGGGGSNAGSQAVIGGAGGSTGAGDPGNAPENASSWVYSGGGATSSSPGNGGGGDYPGAAGSNSPASSSTAFGQGGAGSDNKTAYNYGTAGGGGGGFYGGGGGGSDSPGGQTGSGGGGSGFVAKSATNVRALDGNSGNGSIVITYDDPKDATTIELKASDNPNDATATELTATVSPATATGSVTFTEGSTELGSITLIDGTVTLLNFLSAGTHTITASYSGDTSHGPSTTSTTVTVTAYTAPSFSTDSSTAEPIEKSAAAGETFSFDLKATGTPTPIYMVENDDTDSTILPDGVTFADGILSGSTTRAGTWKIKVTATNSVGTATEYVKLTIAPGTATALEALVSPGDSSSTTLWAVAPDGTVATTITANQGDSIVFDTMPVDQYGNPTTRGNVQPVTTSSVDTDTITYDPVTNLTTVTFNHASPHTITFKVGNLTNSFTVQVTPTPTVTPSPTPTPSAGITPSTSGASASSQLATTGSAPLAPIGWALGILAAGIAVTLVQRRRTTRRVD